MVSPAGEPLQMVIEPRQGQDFGLFSRTRLSIAPDGRAIVHAGDEFMWRTDVGGPGQVQIAGHTDPPPVPWSLRRRLRYRSDGALILHIRPIEAEVEFPRHDGRRRQRQATIAGPARPDRRRRFAVAADDDRLAFVMPDEDENRSMLIGRLSEGIEDFRLGVEQACGPT